MLDDISDGFSITELNLYIYDDETAIRYDDSVMSEPPRPGAKLRLTLFVREIIDEIEKKLGLSWQP